MRGNWLAEELLAYQEGLCCVKLGIITLWSPKHSYPLLRILWKSVVLRKVPRLHPFVPMVRATCRWNDYGALVKC